MFTDIFSSAKKQDVPKSAPRPLVPSRYHPLTIKDMSKKRGIDRYICHGVTTALTVGTALAFKNDQNALANISSFFTLASMGASLMFEISKESLKDAETVYFENSKLIVERQDLDAINSHIFVLDLKTLQITLSHDKTYVRLDDGKTKTGVGRHMHLTPEEIVILKDGLQASAIAYNGKPPFKPGEDSHTYEAA